MRPADTGVEEIAVIIPATDTEAEETTAIVPANLLITTTPADAELATVGIDEAPTTQERPSDSKILALTIISALGGTTMAIGTYCETASGHFGICSVISVVMVVCGIASAISYWHQEYQKGQKTD